MSDDIFEFKPQIVPGIKLNVRALIRAWFGKKRPQSRVLAVAERFLQLFLEHGVAVPQIPHFLSEITLDRLESPATLLPMLSHELLQQTAEIFGVELEWLRGADDRIYPRRFCYKHPDDFFEELIDMKGHLAFEPVQVVYSALDKRSKPPRHESMFLFLTERIDWLGENEICRFRPFMDLWNWEHPPCRIQLKAIARLLYLHAKCSVPLYQAESPDVKRLALCERIPSTFILPPGHDPSLEDYGLSSSESGVAKQTEELEHVLQYIEQHQLERWIPDLKGLKS